MPSADLYARAIIAAAVNYGDDPIEALTVKSGLARRCVAPAITGLARGSQAAISDICRTLGYRTTSISQARSLGGVRFQKAQDAAEEAVRYAIRSAALRQSGEAIQRATSDLGRAAASFAPVIAKATADLGAKVQRAASDARSRQEAPPAPGARPQAIPEPQAATVATIAPPKTIAEVRRRQEARPKGRAIPRGATLQNVGNGVQIIRLKPITPELLARARQQIAKGVTVADFADLFDVDAERLSAALESEAAA